MLTEMRGREATYVYCVVAASRPPRLSRVPSGLPGLGPVRLLDVDEGLFAAAADAPPEQYGEPALRRCLGDLDEISRAALAHQAVVASFASARAVLPMKLFTLFESDARAIEHVRAQHGRIALLVKRVAHHQEWGLRVIRDRAAVAPRKEPLRQMRSGLAYLAHKKAERDARQEPGVQAASETLDTLYDRLADFAGLAKRRPAGELRAPDARLLFDAAFLVPRAKASAFEALASRESR